ncbi:uncharacterized protein PAC_06676 [Phialocephala subalpina]|uniref:Uncharacterized protein n=1 Tax=Phialocephala subalpina TaxID=576137 RepID=A0A1L7WVI9_9HELO|nr:uncharacterized protein PAC_06676 [Phialocephala subalpina]
MHQTHKRSQRVQHPYHRFRPRTRRPTQFIRRLVPAPPVTTQKQGLERKREERFEGCAVGAAHDLNSNDAEKSPTLAQQLETLHLPASSPSFITPPPNLQKAPLIEGKMEGNIYILSNDRNEPPIQETVDILRNERESLARQVSDSATFIAALNAAVNKRMVKEKEKEVLEGSSWIVVERDGSSEARVEDETKLEKVCGRGS